jgi:hypothetical protein
VRQVRRSQLAAALVEFAVAWPIALLIVFTTVQAAVWAAETYGARAASLAGARAGSVVGSSPVIAGQVASQALASTLVGVHPAVWCPGEISAAPAVWVCALDLGPAVEVQVGGEVPALVPLLPGGGLPLHADVVLQKEAFEA